MAKTTRQTTVFGVEDWKRIYQTYREADFQSYDFETLRKSFVDYIRLYYPETFNDYIESSEFIALLDVMAFMGQSLAFRTDLNTRENYLDTAERRDSVVKLANLVGYTPKRNTEASGYLKVFSIQTTENIVDYNGINLANITVNWADPTNFDWQEQFTAILNAALVNTQRYGRPGNRTTINGIRTDEYTINLLPGFLPVLPYSAVIDSINMPFEAVSSTASGRGYVYEPSPRPNGQFNLLFRNDQLGFASANTGFFFLFKQGVLQNQDFNLPERIANRAVNINIEGINNTDRWLYQLDNVGNVAREWEFVESVYTAAVEQQTTLRPLYSVTSRANDQITLNFGDGVFSEIPVGFFRAYVRASNGLQYIINPEEMQNVILSISYVSRTGQLETMTLTCGITEPVSNALARETLDEIKQRAPARYYTQNRMVNGEDYNNFPFTAYNSIIKSKALNRASVGTSRYLDLVDNTGKYSSTNTFGSDGALYEYNDLPTFLFNWVTTNEISDVISNRVEVTLTGDAARQFYYANYPRPSLSALAVSWNQSTTLANETTGYFKNSAGNPVSLGIYASNNLKYVQTGSLIKFTAPSGYYFDANNRLVLGVPTRADEKLTIWAAATAIYLDGTNQGEGNFSNGVGPVVLNNYVPTGAICNLVIPLFLTDLGNEVRSSALQQIELFRNFGLGYNNLTNTWYLITSTNLAVDAPWSQTFAGDTSGANLDASWFVQFIFNFDNSYTVTTRALNYYFGSVLQTRFFFYGDEQIYDSRTGTTIRDFVKVLKTNSRPDSNLPLETDVTMRIIDQPVQPDGYVDDYQVLVSWQDSDADGVPDDPDFFNTLVAPNANALTKRVFFQQIVDFDNLERYILIEPGTINDQYATKDDIEVEKAQYIVGQVFYAYGVYNSTTNAYTTEPAFYVLAVTATGTTVLVNTNEYITRVGRQGLYYQYRHNSPLTNRIDPGSTNIIDIYVVTQAYYTAYRNYIVDSTGTIPEPEVPTIDTLTAEYAGLQDYKMISDNMIINSVTFKPLFGAKAAAQLRATIKVIRASGSTASVSEIKSLVVSFINSYFAIENWNFGDTFYFSELSGYLHQNIGDVVSSVVLVPLNPQKSFGDLYEIRSAPNEIFVNAATVADIQVIEALTSTNLRTAPGSGVI
jgi:hypothetical protein